MERLVKSIVDDRPGISRGKPLPEDPYLLKQRLLGPEWFIHPDLVAGVLQRLHEAGALTPDVVWALLLKHAWQRLPDEPAVAREHAEDLVWQLTADPAATRWERVPKRVPLRGLRFVLRALTWPDQPKELRALGTAELTPEESAALTEHLRTRPEAEIWRAVDYRGSMLLSLLGLADAEALLEIARATFEAHYPERQDLAEILAAARKAGPQGVEKVLGMWPSEIVEAALGRNR